MLQFVQESCPILSHSLSAGLNEIESSCAETHEGSLEDFRALYLTNGELIYKKQLMRDELEVQIQTREAQQQVCMETLNPDARMYAQEKKELLRQQEEVDAEIGNLASQQNLYLEWFGPTERYLAIMDKPYVHPKDELEKRNAERAGKITEYKALMAAPADEEDLEIEEQLRITYGGCFTPSYGSNIAAGGSAKELPMPPHPPTQGSACAYSGRLPAIHSSV
jgi:hypothetical protein